jgi:hypothetical protein
MSAPAPVRVITQAQATKLMNMLPAGLDSNRRATLLADCACSDDYWRMLRLFPSLTPARINRVLSETDDDAALLEADALLEQTALAGVYTEEDIDVLLHAESIIECRLMTTSEQSTASTERLAQKREQIRQCRHAAVEKMTDMLWDECFRDSCESHPMDE